MNIYSVAIVCISVAGIVALIIIYLNSKSNNKEGKMKTSEYSASILLKQIEEQNQQCAFWLVSVIAKLLSENPELKLREFFSLIEKELPNSVEEYRNYLKIT